jgi:KDO2-lipid IV(A) lauroyltransferase
MYYLFILGKTLALILPRNMGYFLAKICAVAKYYFSKKDRETVNYNLGPVIRDVKERRKVALEVFVNFSYYLVDFFRYSKLDKKFIEKYVKIDGLEYLNRYLAENNGVIALSAHLGNYELGGAVAALLGYPIYAVALPHKDKRTNELFNRQRECVGMKVISTGATVKKCFSCLNQGNMIAFLGDRDFSGGGVKVKMFSRYARLPRGPVFFAIKTGASIVPCFFVRENKKYYRFIFVKPIFLNRGDSKGKDEEKKALEEYVSVLEKYIKKYPQQWYMFEKYWLKT